ncbi:putative glycoprotease GCP [Saprospira grandis DSM 2844]|uniref:tRNA N6-adenosine threonylcarbamoyltransferase n=1 Tax=Saprospira grandis DSM 2844 TaxID=694433 RepID=J0XX88_9BACT|nr:tRNA (adenosine(37)-N6)-threonylcarbamoyltransferase complex transferase subunit TsaD [Saprospira grandis]EJF53671.1 putative glycoprotease GCP [Saprospira grandis DSM 2844]
MSLPYILAIESSCDDTAAAVMQGPKVLSNCRASQTVHEAYGGVVPELASRAHQAHIVPVVQAALKEAGIVQEQLSAVAFTRGPGLMGALLVGVSFAKGLALALDIPLIAVNHVQAHVMAHLIDAPQPKFPFLCLTVSGGHTQIVEVRAPLSMNILGESIDDAAGEAFDKIGKILGLGYPAGPKIDQLAKEGRAIYQFTEPRVEGLNFSFSGLKTNVLQFIQKKLRENPQFLEEEQLNLVASVQERIVSILMNKLKKAIKQTGIKEVAIAGGVSANSALRQALAEAGQKRGWATYIPDFQYCTDNAGMIGITAYYQYLAGEFVQQDTVPLARWSY